MMKMSQNGLEHNSLMIIYNDDDDTIQGIHVKVHNVVGGECDH